MTLYIGSLALIVIAAGYMIVTGTASRWAAAGLCFIAAAAFGFLAVQTTDYRLGLATLAATVFAAAAAAAYLKRFDGAFSLRLFFVGMLGAEAGVYFGLFFYLSTKFIIGADILFVVLTFGLQKLTEQLSARTTAPAGLPEGKAAASASHAAKAYPNQNRNPRDRRKTGSSGFAPTILCGLLAIVLVSLLLTQTDASRIDRIGQVSSAKAVYDESNALQTATVEVNGAGFNPRNIDFQADIMIKLIIEVTAVTSGDMLFESKDLDMEAPLHKGENIFLIKKPKTGVYAFSVGSTSMKGTFTVKTAEQ